MSLGNPLVILQFGEHFSVLDGHCIALKEIALERVRKMLEINKEDLTLRELNELQPTYGVLNGVNFSSVKYYKEDGKVFEVSTCTDGSLSKRMEELKHLQEVGDYLKRFDLAH